jgi:hypothetical protein
MSAEGPARGQSAGSAQPDFSHDEIAAIDAFHDAGWEMVRLHDARGEGMERKAANLLGLAGLALVLVPFAVNDLDGEADTAAAVVHWGTGVGAVALSVGALLCVATLWPRKSSVPDSGQLRRQWADFCQARPRTHKAAEIKAMLTGSLLVGNTLSGGDKPGVLTTTKSVADGKAKFLTVGAALIALAVVSLAASVVAALVHGTS